MADSHIHHLINLRQRKIFFRGGIIQVGIVHAHTPLVVLLRNKYHVREPLRVLNLLYEPNNLEIVYFLLYHFLSGWMEPPQPLLDWPTTFFVGLAGVRPIQEKHQAYRHGTRQRYQRTPEGGTTQRRPLLGIAKPPSSLTRVCQGRTRNGVTTARRS